MSAAGECNDWPMVKPILMYDVQSKSYNENISDCFGVNYKVKMKINSIKSRIGQYWLKP